MSLANNGGKTITYVESPDNYDIDVSILQAVSYLHESGVLLHYKDSNLQLRDFYFIDPGWLCRMMAQVITVKQINPFITREGVGI